MKRYLCALLVAGMVVGVAPVAFGQGVNTKATLTGVVQDASGSVVPGASVVIKNVATGVTNETVSNGTGSFAVAALDAGTYQATVSLTGFKTFKIDKIVLTPGDTANVTARLEVGQAEETITVSARSELIDTTSTTVSSTISSDQIQSLPVVTKSAMQIVTFMPGINSQTGTHQQRASTALGLPQSAIAIVIDGVNIQDQSVKSTDGFYPDIRPQNDLVEQVSIAEATGTADSSGQGAVQIKFVTRSGSNQLNGSAYEYLRDGKLNSNSWANKSKGLPKNEINWNQYGFRIGGPVVIPGLYDGHNKAFFFVNYEEFRLPITSATTRQTLSPSAQGGLFQYGCIASGCSGAVNVLQLAAKGGQISSIDPTIAAMNAQISAAVATQGSIQKNVDLNTFQYSWQPNLFRAEHLPGGRLDVNLTNNHRLTVTQVFQKVNSDPDIINNGYPSYPGFAVDSTQYSFRYSGSASMRSTLTKNMVNEGGWGTIWSPVYFSANITPDRYFGGYNLAYPTPPTGTPALAPFNVTGTAQNRNGSNYNIHDTLSWLKGNHSLSFGGVFTKVTDLEQSHSIIQGLSLGFDTTNDPAAGLFNTTNFPGATAADLTNARNLYALLTGRISQVTGNAVLQPNGQYVYRGDPTERIHQNELGLFAQDQWRLKPTFTVNAGVRYELQYPIQPEASIYSRNDLNDLCGRAGMGAAASNAPLATIGCPFGQPGIPLTGAAPTYKQYTGGDPGYNLDKNNFAPSVGVAWQPNRQSGWLRQILGDPTYATVRTSYGRAFNQPGTSDYLGTLRNGPGLTVNANRNTANNNLVPAGESWPILLSQTSRLAPPGSCTGSQNVGCIPTSVSFPQAIAFNTGILEFDPNYQTSYTDSWSVGFQRSLTKDTSFEIRYIGNRTEGISTSVNYNEQDIYNAAFGGSSSFLDEFRKAQRNLAANVAAGRGPTFAYTGIAGTSPLPIFLASYLGLSPANAGDPSKYTGGNWTNSATISSLSLLTPNIGTFASTNTTNGLFGNPTFRASGVAAGMPANFWVMNPDVISDSLRTAEGFTHYGTLQLLVNHRLTKGLAFSFNYSYQEQFASSLDTLFRQRALLRSTGAPPHAFKLTTNYEVPVGRGQHFGTDINPWLDGVIGHWQINLTGRVETGRLWDIGDVKLVNMSLSDLQHEFKYYTNPADGFVYNLPQDLIANTIRAWTIDVTSPTGHPACTGSNAATCGGPDPTKPYIAPPSSADCTTIITGDCNTRQQLLKAPLFTRFDLSIKKRFPFAGRASFDFGIDILNVFGAIDFNSVFPSGSALATVDNYRVTTAYADINNTYDPGGRIGQLVFRVNW
jgi:hypothetical protein